MNKISIQALNDYLEDPIDINLKLFVHSINPLAKYKKAELINLIGKYSKDKSKLRLKSIEEYLGNTNVKIAKKSKINYLPEKIIKNPEKFTELEELKRRYVANLKRAGSKTAIEENDRLFQEIDKLESELGLKFDYKEIPLSGVEESEEALLKGILGDYENPSSIAWELLNGTKQYFQVDTQSLCMLGGGVTQIIETTPGYENLMAKSESGIKKLIRVLERVSGKKARKLNINMDFDKVSSKQILRFSSGQVENTFTQAQKELNNYNVNLERLNL